MTENSHGIEDRLESWGAAWHKLECANQRGQKAGNALCAEQASVWRLPDGPRSSCERTTRECRRRTPSCRAHRHPATSSNSPTLAPTWPAYVTRRELSRHVECRARDPRLGSGARDFVYFTPSPVGPPVVFIGSESRSTSVLPISDSKHRVVLSTELISMRAWESIEAIPTTNAGSRCAVTAVLGY